MATEKGPLQKNIKLTDNLSSNQLQQRLENFRTEMKRMEAENAVTKRYHTVWTKKFSGR